MISEEYSDVDTMTASIIALYCCWSSHFPDYRYIFLIFSRHLCSYEEQLLNEWSSPIENMCPFRRSYCNNPLMIIYSCSKKSISKIISITFSTHVILRTVQQDHFCHLFEITNIIYMEKEFCWLTYASFSVIVYDFLELILSI